MERSRSPTRRPRSRSRSRSPTRRPRVDRGASVWNVVETTFVDDYKLRGSDPSTCSFTALYATKAAAERRKYKLMVDYIAEDMMADLDDRESSEQLELELLKCVLERERNLLRTEKTTPEDVRRVRRLVEGRQRERFPEPLPDDDAAALEAVFRVAEAAEFVNVSVDIDVSEETVR
jgi:hypothetical protein